VVTLPIELAGEFHDVRLVIEREASGEETPEKAMWRVSVHLDLPKLGGIDVTVMLRGELVSVGFECDEPSTSRWLGRSLESLSAKLERQDFKVDRLETEVAHAPELTTPNRPGNGIEVKA
jgi:hypothetical protein